MTKLNVLISFHSISAMIVFLVATILDFSNAAGLSETEFFVYIPDRKIGPLLFSDYFLAERLKQKISLVRNHIRFLRYLYFLHPCQQNRANQYVQVGTVTLMNYLSRAEEEFWFS